MRILKPVADSRRINQRRNENIIHEINIFELRENINEYQQIYYEHILRIPTDRISRKPFHCHPKGRRERGRLLKRWRN
jgi:hypothetical protein